MKQANTARRAGHQRGFGLVEMMVSLALGLVVVGGALVLFLSTRQASSSTDNLSRMQDSVRTSYDLMSREVREAGGTPCDAQVAVSDVLSNAQGATPTWWSTWGEAVHGYDTATAFPGAAFGTAFGERVTSTAAILVRSATPMDGIAVSAHDTTLARFTANVAAHGIAAGDVLMVCSYRQAAILQVTDINLTTGTFDHAAGVGSPGNCNIGLGLPTVCTVPGTTFQFAAGSSIGRFVASGWYIGNNGRPATGGRSLFRASRSGVEEVAEGVRDLQLSYLVTGGTDYVDAGSVTDWATVVAVRVQLGFESPDTNQSTTASAQRLTRTVAFTLNLRNLQP